MKRKEKKWIELSKIWILWSWQLRRSSRTVLWMAYAFRNARRMDMLNIKELEEMGKVTIPYTGNAAADGVLYHYGCIARAKNIEFSVCCYLKDIAIPDTDFCTILGNALDNAVTAAGQYDGKRFIEVATEKKHDMLLITVDNSFDGILFQENGKIYSKKRQNKQEGIGILSMKKLCEKHGGASRFEAVGNRFQASFILKNEVED